MLLKDSGQGVVVGRGDRIELVIVAAGAGHGHAEKAAARDVDLIVDLVVAELLGALSRDRFWDRSPKSRWRSAARSCLGRVFSAGSRSPASCSTMNRSYGLSALNASMT